MDRTRIKNPILILLTVCLLFTSICVVALFSSASINIAEASSVNTAKAASDEYIKIPAKDLVGNSVAQVSSIPMRNLESGNIIFYLHESYYVKVKSYNTDSQFYTVEYMGLSGSWYISKADLGDILPSSPDFEDESPYPDKTLRLMEGAEISIGQTVIKETDGYTIKYVGGTDNQNTVFVKAAKGSTLLQGAVQKSAFQAFTVPYHKISEAERSAILNGNNNQTDAGNDDVKTSKTLRIILIIGITVPALLIVFLIFKPSKGVERSYDKRLPKKQRGDKSFDYDSDRRYDRNTQNLPRDYDSRGYNERDYDDRFKR